MKKGWTTKRIGEIARHSLGKMLDKAKNRGEPKPYLRNLNVRWGEFDLSDLLEMRFLPEEAEKYTAVKGDVLVCEGGYPGRAAIWDRDEPIYFQKALHRVRFHEPERNKWFVHYLQFRDLEGTLRKHFNGAGIQHFTGEALAQFEIPVPPLAEQQRIVGVLDEAFAGLATAQAHAAQNLQNARALFESHLQSVFTHRGKGWVEKAGRESGRDERQKPIDDAEMARLHAGYVSRTGGREATTRHIPGPLSLSVGIPEVPPRKGWRWSALSDLARLESGHTPSRRHPEYWGGSIPWIGIQDARSHHGGRIESTAQTINELGTANSSARLLPANTVCLSRTASVGYVVVMGRPMATSQDFVNWVCSEELLPDFLKYIFLAEGRDGLLRYASGSVHQTIYFPEAKAFHICHPSADEQRKIVEQCDALAAETQRLTRLYEQKQAALAALKKSLLHQAFSGEL